MTKRLRRAAAAELVRIDRTLARIDVRRRTLEGELEAADASRRKLEQQRCTLAALAGDNQTEPPKPPRHTVSASGSTTLAGASIREEAVRLLLSKLGQDAAIHYRDWYELFTSDGLKARGKDPLATFLTQITRSPLVRRSTAHGVYSLDMSFIPRGERRQADLRRKLASSYQAAPATSPEGLAEVRMNRDRWTHELRTIERELAEALRSTEQQH